MSESLPQVETSKPLTIVKPTEQNFLMFSEYRNGLSCKEIGKKYGLVERTVSHHVSRVKDFLGDSWEKYVLTAQKLKHDKVSDAQDGLIKDRDSKTVNNYLNKMVYPDRSGKGTAIQLNVNNIVGGMSSNAGYDTDVEVVEAEVDE